MSFAHSGADWTNALGDTDRTAGVPSRILSALATAMSLDALPGTGFRTSIQTNVRPVARDDLWTNSGARWDGPPARPSPTASAVFELKALTAMTWGQLAGLFGVDRRSVHAWAAGGRLAAKREERLFWALREARENSSKGPDAVRALLGAPSTEPARHIQRVGMSSAARATTREQDHPVDRLPPAGD